MARRRERKRICIAISLDRDLVKRIDDARQLVARSRFIEKIVKDNLVIRDWIS